MKACLKLHKFKFYNLEIRFHKRQVSLLVVKTFKSKHRISVSKYTGLAYVICFCLFIVIGDQMFLEMQDFDFTQI